jgi:hypothetical protein
MLSPKPFKEDVSSLQVKTPFTAQWRCSTADSQQLVHVTAILDNVTISSR